MQSLALLSYPWNAHRAAGYMDVSVGHLYNLLTRGRGPRHIRYGRQLRFRPEDLDVWLARHCAVSRRPPDYA